MTMIALLLAAAAPAAAQQSVSAEEALKLYETEFKLENLPCRAPDNPEEIVVCGRADPDDSGPRSIRVPYVPEPGRRIPGEPSVDGGGCIRLCHQPLKVDLLKVPGVVKKFFKYFRDE